MSTKGRVAGKVAIVTGASSGIGESTAKVLAAEGASVCVADVDVENGRRVVAEISDAGNTAWFHRTDVTSTPSLRRMIERTEAKFGRLDILHNNAIWFQHGSATELDEKAWDKNPQCRAQSCFHRRQVRHSDHDEDGWRRHRQYSLRAFTRELCRLYRV